MIFAVEKPSSGRFLFRYHQKRQPGSRTSPRECSYILREGNEKKKWNLLLMDLCFGHRLARFIPPSIETYPVEQWKKLH